MNVSQVRAALRDTMDQERDVLEWTREDASRLPARYAGTDMAARVRNEVATAGLDAAQAWGTLASVCEKLGLNAVEVLGEVPA